MGECYNAPRSPSWLRRGGIRAVDSEENHWKCCHQMSHLKAKMLQSRYWLRSASDSTGKDYSAPPEPLAWFKGPTSKGRGGREGQEGRGGKGRGEEERGRQRPPPCVGMGPRMVNPALLKAILFKGFMSKS